MSDPVSNAEIEDVLSSIRRLISESSASEGRESSAKAEKLVLTPAFRVHDDSGASDSDKVGTQSSVLELAEPVKSKAVEVSAEEVTKQTDQPIEVDPGSDGAAVPVFSHRGYSNATVEDAEELPVADEEAEEPIATSLTGRAADFEDAVKDRSNSWEPDGGEETTQSDVLMFHAARLHSDQDGILGDTTAEEWTKSDRVPEAPFVAVEDPLRDDAQSIVEPVEMNTAPTVRNMPSQNVEIVGEDTDIIDEEIVHAMVARLVREELQGEVGEKITQSIRRFVRREIERAVTLKGLE